MVKSVLWNLGLAAIPAVLGYLLAWLLGKRGKGGPLLLLVTVPVALAWLTFLPNSCYLLTEWRHLLFDGRWEDLRETGNSDRLAMLRTAKWALFFLVYSGTGMLLFVLSIRPVERWLRSVGQKFYFYAPFLFFLVSLGVYLGLLKRFNTWDLLHRPRFIWNSALEALQVQPLLLAVGIFAVLLWVMYEAVDIWVDGVVARLPGKGGGGGGARKSSRAKGK